MVRMITNVLKFTLKQTWIGIRFAYPWAIRLFLTTTWRSVLGIVGIFRGVPQTSRQVAMEWTKRAVIGGFPSLWDGYLYQIFFYMTIGAILTGWLIMYFLTAFAFWIAGRFIFGN